MNMRTIIVGGLSALALAGVLSGQGVASKASEQVAASAKAAHADARRAAKALDKQDAVTAIRHAEAAVALAPRSAEYRMLLGQGYLQGGRFASATATFGDVLALDPAQDKAALNLALAQVATGDWQGARGTLNRYQGRIAAPDHGLALALAGDPAGAVQLLMEAAREKGADAKVRQNLALALALAGQWQSARVVAATDLSPADVDQRLQQWAAFAQPSSASDQVASLLGVTAASDPGQPVALALNTPAVPVGVQPALAVVEPVPVVEAAAAIAAPAAMAGVIFGARAEVVQALPVPVLRPEARRARLALAAATIGPRVEPIRHAGAPLTAAKLFRRAPATGNWYVQLGAYENAAVARDAWGRFSRRQALFGGRLANGSSIKVQGASLFRLSVGGFARADADALCRRHRAQGGACFVRAGAGDQVVRWDRRSGTQLASR